MNGAEMAAARYRQNRWELGKLRRYARKEESPAPERFARIKDLERDVSAVEKAIKDLQAIALEGEDIIEKRKAQLTLELVELCYVKAAHTLIGAACVMSIPPSTARSYNSRFIRMVAGNYEKAE